MGPGERAYHEQVDPITRDKRADVIPRSALRRQQIKLDNALNAQQFRLRGDVIFLDRSSTGLVNVQLNNTSEDLFPMAAGDGIEGLPFEDVFITSTAQAGLVVNLWYGYSARFKSFLTQTVTSILQSVAGAPQGIDQTVSNGNAFEGYGSIIPVNVAHVQLFNPAANTKILYVDEIWHLAPANNVLLSFNAAALTTLTVGPLTNRNLGGAAPTAEIRTQDNVSLIGQDVERLRGVGEPASSKITTPCPTPWRIPPGRGLIVVDQTGAQTLLAGFKWREF